MHMLRYVGLACHCYCSILTQAGEKLAKAEAAAAAKAAKEVARKREREMKEARAILTMAILRVLSTLALLRVLWLYFYFGDTQSTLAVITIALLTTVARAGGEGYEA